MTPRLHPRALETVCIVYEAAREAGIEPLEVIVFGSWARGDWLWTSDIDVIIVSRGCGEKPLERVDAIYSKIVAKKPPVWPELLCYTPEGLEEATRRATIVRDASRYWIRIPREQLGALCKPR